MTGGTMTGGTTTGGTTTVTGGTVTVIGGTVTVTGGTLTGSGTEMVTVPGFEWVGGVCEPVLGVVAGVLVTVVEGVGGVGVTTGVVGVTTVLGAGLVDGVGLLVAVCCFGTMMSVLPPLVGGAEPK